MRTKSWWTRLARTSTRTARDRAIHGDMSQQTRMEALEAFKAGGFRFWSPPTSRRAGLTSTTWRSSSTSNCRTRRKITSIASAAPGARAPRARRFPSSRRRKRNTWRTSSGCSRRRCRSCPPTASIRPRPARIARHAARAPARPSGRPARPAASMHRARRGRIPPSLARRVRRAKIRASSASALTSSIRTSRPSRRRPPRQLTPSRDPRACCAPWFRPRPAGAGAVAQTIRTGTREDLTDGRIESPLPRPGRSEPRAFPWILSTAFTPRGGVSSL